MNERFQIHTDDTIVPMQTLALLDETNHSMPFQFPVQNVLHSCRPFDLYRLDLVDEVVAAVAAVVLECLLVVQVSI